MTGLTINNNATYKSYSSASGQTDFVYDWYLRNATDLRVYKTLAGQQRKESDLLEYTTDYTVTNVGVENGGIVKLNSGASTGDTILIIAYSDLTQKYDFAERQTFTPTDFDISFADLKADIKELRTNLEKLKLTYADNADITRSRDLLLPTLSAGCVWRKDIQNAKIDSVLLSDSSITEVLAGNTTGGPENYLLTLSGFTTPRTDQLLIVDFTVANTTSSPALSINGGASYPVKFSDNISLRAGDLQPLRWTMLAWTPNNYWHVINPYSSYRAFSESDIGISRGATTIEAKAGTNNLTYMTPAKTEETINNKNKGIALAGTNTAYTGTIDGNASLEDGNRFVIIPNLTSGASPTLQLTTSSGTDLGAHEIVDRRLNSINPGILSANVPYQVEWSATLEKYILEIWPDTHERYEVIYGNTTGGPVDYVIDSFPNFTENRIDQILLIDFINPNTTDSPTLAINGGAAIPLKFSDNISLRPGDLTTAQWTMLLWTPAGDANGTYHVVNPYSSYRYASDTEAGVMRYATQAELNSRTGGTTVSSDTIHLSPFAIKGFAKCNGSTLDSAARMSMVKQGNGHYRYTFDVPALTNYCVFVTFWDGQALCIAGVSYIDGQNFDVFTNQDNNWTDLPHNVMVVGFIA